MGQPVNCGDREKGEEIRSAVILACCDWHPSKKIDLGFRENGCLFLILARHDATDVHHAAQDQ